jgi:hypothetical protein
MHAATYRRYLIDGAKQSIVLRATHSSYTASTTTDDDSTTTASTTEATDTVAATADAACADSTAISQWSFVTSDEPPVVLGICDDATAAVHHIAQNDLLRFSTETAYEEEQFSNSSYTTDSYTSNSFMTDSYTPTRPAISGLVYDKKCSIVRPAADCWSKILFQYRVRSDTDRIAIQDIINAAAANTTDNSIGNTAAAAVSEL